MITYQVITADVVSKLNEIDRSEFIDVLYHLDEDKLNEAPAHYEYAGWTTEELKEIQQQYILELTSGGMAVGAFENDLLVGFGVLGHRFMGENFDQLPVDLMYVSRNFRRQGIGSEILKMLSAEAKNRGAGYLYVSSTETKSAVSFYSKNGSAVTRVVDEILFNKEPRDIHMVIKLDLN
ncbi:GNAT superfamily N-acetyltransferase [Pedobacter cryoconitis]|uniref:GNAT family N-acetyltransferase n=1 Tax=Pedobacter cryoconitis TaxID=188932 RepID=UPI00161F8C0A|nr:GNAT family N-acetyltransferase [Pedobacter cryoconitis]MBB6272368.1 GNAT superfamily N-acetyltransferase [Pedobacter cryoconitis]